MTPHQESQSAALSRSAETLHSVSEPVEWMLRVIVLGSCVPNERTMGSDDDDRLPVSRCGYPVTAVVVFTDRELLAGIEASLQELRRRGIARTSNAPTGDYAESLALKVLGGELASNSAKSYDLVTAAGDRIQVKARVIRNGSAGERQLSPFRSFDFEHALIILFDGEYRSSVHRPGCGPRPRYRPNANVPRGSHDCRGRLTTTSSRAAHRLGLTPGGARIPKVRCRTVSSRSGKPCRSRNGAHGVRAIAR